MTETEEALVEAIKTISDTSRRLGYLQGVVEVVLSRPDVEMPDDVRRLLGEALG